MRALRQEQERMREVYEDRAANPSEAKKANELEKELQRTKEYYHKRIRELEDKYKFKVSIGAVDDKKPKTKATPPKETPQDKSLKSSEKARFE